MSFCLSLRKHKPGDKKEVVVYRGWSRHVQHVPVDENGRVSISPRYLVPAQPVCVCCSIAARRADIQSTAAAGSRTPATTLISTRASPKAHPSEKGPSENPGRGPLHRPHAHAADLRAEPGAQASLLFPIPEEHTERQCCC